jgi:uncharacterized YigZ family protein
MKGYVTVAGPAEAGFTEKRSRFIGAISPCRSYGEAAAFLAEKKRVYWDASHNCHAFLLRSGEARFSDDGEPHGTAGAPILEVLKKENIEDAVIVVTRYFGGTLLGAGGLVRAYSRAAKLALDSAERLELKPCAVFSLDVPYAMYDRILALINKRGVTVINSDFGAAVRLELRAELTAFDAFAAAVTEASGGALFPEMLREEFA